MNVDERELTVIGFIITWVAGVFGMGKIYGTANSTLERHDQEIKEIQKEFTTEGGEPRLVSYAAHDKIQAACQAIIAERHLALGHRLEQQDKKLDQILSAVCGKADSNHGG